jgi:Ulp1 family protease
MLTANPPNPTTPNSYDFTRVQRWTKPTYGQNGATLLDMDRIIMPINHGNVHWTCAMIDLVNKEIVSYDSKKVSIHTHTNTTAQRTHIT